MNKYLFFKLTIALTAVLFLFSACTGKKTDKSNELRYGFTTEPTTLDPLKPGNTADGRSILFNVFEGLIKPDVNGQMQPCIAESWTIEQDGLVYNFTLRDGMFFHDGSFVTADDVKFSLDTAIAAGFHGLNNIKETQITSANQISVLLKVKDPDFLPYLTTGIVKADNPDREKNIIGTGPFFIENYSPQKNLTLVKFDNYHQSNLPHLEKVTLVFFANYDTLMLALRGGSIDGAFITGSMAAQLDRKRFDIFNNRSAGVQLLALNNAHTPLDDIRIRRAINYSVDVQGIIDTAFFGQGSPSGSPIIPGLSAYYNDTLSYPHNPDLARSLLNEAGFNDTNRLSLEITVPSNFTMHIDTAQVIVSQLEKTGINASIKLVDWSTWLSDVYFGRQYEATVITLDSQIVSPRGFLTRYHSANGENFLNFNNVDFDRVFDAALTETDNAKRIELYKDAQRIITENAAGVYIQDILYFITLRGNAASNAFSGALDYPLYVIDFASIYRTNNN
ncbi:MAG: ABC transporter substrate-binding protein [Treponema sp.]|jgi:peptide/nickel transport system substrate-binding protein|nr:ABC transporter substrate-binding protein [Treponema sp.]